MMTHPEELAARETLRRLQAVLDESPFDEEAPLSEDELPSEAEARACLDRLSGRRHRVLGAVAVRYPDGASRMRLVETVVRFKRLEQAEIDDYLGCGEWRGKAGGYAIQGRAARFVDFLSGSYSNVVGLPLFETVKLLKPALS